MMDEHTPISQAEPEQPDAGPAAVKKTNAVLNSVQADAVQINKSSVIHVTGETVTARDSGIRQITAQTVDLTNSVVAVAHGAQININSGGVGICSASDATINGNTGVMIGQSVTLNDHRSGLVVTREVNGGHIQSVIFLAGHSNAPVETIVDQRSVALFGIATGVAMGLVLSLFRILKR
jgi:hypothetical protein